MRSGMEQLVQEVRANAAATLNETTIDNVTYWSNDHLQDALDHHRVDFRETQLVPFPEYETGVRVTKRYYFPDVLTRYVERGSLFVIRDSMGNLAPSYTVDYDGRVVVFASDTNGTNYYVYGRMFDFASAVAEVWATKASHRVQLINWRAGGQSFEEDQEYQHCIEQYNKWMGKSMLVSRRMRKIGYA